MRKNLISICEIVLLAGKLRKYVRQKKRAEQRECPYPIRKADIPGVELDTETNVGIAVGRYERLKRLGRAASGLDFHWDKRIYSPQEEVLLLPSTG